MKKVLVIGCPGSGKSTLSRALQKRTQLPLFYLDRMNWNPDRTTVEREVFRKRLRLCCSRRSGLSTATMLLPWSCVCRRVIPSSFWIIRHRSAWTAFGKAGKTSPGYAMD